MAAISEERTRKANNLEWLKFQRETHGVTPELEEHIQRLEHELQPATKAATHATR